jgi:hypothetical protein
MIIIGVLSLLLALPMAAEKKKHSKWWYALPALGAGVLVAVVVKARAGGSCTANPGIRNPVTGNWTLYPTVCH